MKDNKPLSKEEILNPISNHYNLSIRAHKRFSDAMDEYAAQESIAFAEWATERHFVNFRHSFFIRNYFNIKMRLTNTITYTMMKF